MLIKQFNLQLFSFSMHLNQFLFQQIDTFCNNMLLDIKRIICIFIPQNYLGYNTQQSKANPIQYLYMSHFNMDDEIPGNFAFADVFQVSNSNFASLFGSSDQNQYINQVNSQASPKPMKKIKQRIRKLIKPKNRRRNNKNSKKGKFSLKFKMNKRQKPADYRKNICGYITKKAMRELNGPNYKEKVMEMCSFQNVCVEKVKSFYAGKIDRVTGPSHIPQLLSAKNQEQIPIVRAFTKFFKWFLQNRYTRHLFLQGKMEQRNVYIEYKNLQLIPLIEQFQRIQEKAFETFTTAQSSQQISNFLK